MRSLKESIYHQSQSPRMLGLNCRAWGSVCSVHWGSRSMSHKVLLLLALVGPILLIAAGSVAHVWGRRRKRLRAAGQEPENSK